MKMVNIYLTINSIKNQAMKTIGFTNHNKTRNCNQITFKLKTKKDRKEVEKKKIEAL